MPQDQTGSSFSGHSGNHPCYANDMELIAEECKANNYIRKPFDVEGMVGKVVRIVNHLPLAC